jgi:RNA polymerase sigma-70 factor (ECF subfamily)
MARRKVTQLESMCSTAMAADPGAVTFSATVSSYISEGRRTQRGVGPVKNDEDNEQIAEAWRNNRSYLVDLAFRMLGDIGEAEDIVQEAFSRLIRAAMDEIDDKRGWLIVVTSRLCLDHIRSARSRRQRPYDLGESDIRLLDPTPGAVDPADRVTLDDNVRIALLVVLERLSPAERVAYVLHDIFQMPFATIAATVGKTVPTCRQLARRARLKIEEADSPGRLHVGSSEHRLITEKFITACAGGDLDGLLEVLDPAVSGTIDIRPDFVTTGAADVARTTRTYWGRRGTLVSQPSGEDTTILAFLDRQLSAVFLLSFGDRSITKIHGIAAPSKLAFLQDQLSTYR